MRLALTWLALALALPCVALAAQDTLPPVEQGVRVGITYTPGVRPGMLVLGGPSLELLDSVRAMLARDLDHSDRFEMITLPGGDSLVLGIGGSDSEGDAREEFVNYRLYAALGADYAVHVRTPVDSTVRVVVHDVRGEGVRREITMGVADPADGDFRMMVHRASDEVVRAAAGTPGVAATRLLLLQRGRVYRIDSDGAGLEIVSPRGVNAFSPGWAPDGKHVVYTEFADHGGRIYTQNIEAGERRLLDPTSRFLNYAPAFSPDGRQLVFTQSGDEGTDVYSYNVADDCCLQRLTVGRFSDNLSPRFSPDGRRVAFVSTRAGLPQIYVMAADGTGQELFAPFDYGVTGSSNSPEWSPDGLNLAFHRDVAGSPQVFVMDVATRTVRQLTSAGRNEDPTWAPDGRHLAFVSNRTGSRQIWVIDLDTGRIRQVTRLGDARLPAWSPRID